MIVRTYAELLQEYEQERANPEWTPVRLGFGTIDAEIRGISPGQVLGIAARSGVGKTTIQASIEHNFAASGHGQLSLSLEMPGPEWAEKALAIHADVAPEQVEVWAAQRQLAEHSASFLRRMQHALLVEDAVALGDMGGVVAEARAKLTVPLRLVQVDYMGLLRAPGNSAYERMSAVAREVKMFAKQERVAVILAMQLSRAGGAGGTPVTLDMVRDSGVAEESCDFLLGVWRPGKAMEQEQRDALIEEELEELDSELVAAVLKNRKGKEGRWVSLQFNPSSRRVFEPSDPFRPVAP